MKKQFEQQIEAFTKKREALKKQFHLFGFIKLFLLLAFGISLFLTFSQDIRLFGLIDFVLLCLQVFFWVQHSRTEKKIAYCEALVLINERNLQRIDGGWNTFTDTGEEFIDRDHPYGSDLDIVGKKSLFQFLNSTHTWHGRQRFAADLLKQAYSPEEITGRQRAITELAGDSVYATGMEYHFRQIGVDATAPQLEAALGHKARFAMSAWLKPLMQYLPFFSLLYVIAVLGLQLDLLFVTVPILLCLHILLFGLTYGKTSGYLKDVTKLPYRLSSYSVVFSELSKKSFQSYKLKQLQKAIAGTDSSAEAAFSQLGKLADRVNIKHNALIYFLMNIFLFWDFRCALRLEAWKKKYAGHAATWFSALGEFESLLCLSKLRHVCSLTSIPAISDKKRTIRAQDLGHPLIHNDSRIANHFACDDGIYIISGSNMSGKTTFLRTVGINLVLAKTGSFVCAGAMTVSPMQIVTSMRIADDLNEGISTFYAELKRIKSIIDAAKKTTDLLFLIDEIFRGTNSVDRMSGAKTVLTRLDALGVSGMITTHDLELCKLSAIAGRIHNYHFSEHYENDSIHFDYKLKAGASTTTNAKFLMKMVGITE